MHTPPPGISMVVQLALLREHGQLGRCYGVPTTWEFSQAKVVFPRDTPADSCLLERQF